MKNRNTLQRRLVLETVRRMRNHPTAEEIYLAIAAENPLISKATVYRNLKLLSEQGESLRIPIPDGADRFDFNVAPHYHVKCRICNQVSDVDMPYIEAIAKMVVPAKTRWYLNEYDMENNKNYIETIEKFGFKLRKCKRW